MKTFYLLVLQLMIAQSVLSDEPSWSKDIPKLTGSYLYVSCHGLGPDKDLAFRQALDQCRSIASDYLGGAFKTKSISVESEEETGFHQEVSSRYEVYGLVPVIEKSKEEEIDDTYHVYMRCKFNTRSAKIVPVFHGDDYLGKSIVKSPKRNLLVYTVPYCNSLVIRGTITKMVKCKGNPQVVTIDEKDTSILVRAKGHQAKDVDLTPSDETLEVYLERN